jgi:hypothetical protein
LKGEVSDHCWEHRARHIIIMVVVMMLMMMMLMMMMMMAPALSCRF